MSTWSPVASQSEVTFGRSASGGDNDVIPGTANDEVAASDMEWGEPVWSDAVPADPPPPAVDWRKSIPREFVARRSPPGRPVHEPVRPDSPPPVVPMANGQTYAPAPPAPPAPTATPGPGAKPTWPAEAEGDAQAPAGRHAVRGGRDEPSRAGGINGMNRAAPTPTGETAAGEAPTGVGGQDDDAAPSSDDTGVWNALDREIARALATALAGKLAQYVTGPILPLVADELARMVGTSPAPTEEGEGGSPTGERRPRHFGDGAPRR